MKKAAHAARVTVLFIMDVPGKNLWQAMPSITTAG
jgi:hypothetical protein